MLFQGTTSTLNAMNAEDTSLTAKHVMHYLSFLTSNAFNVESMRVKLASLSSACHHRLRLTPCEIFFFR